MEACGVSFAGFPFGGQAVGVLRGTGQRVGAQTLCGEVVSYLS